MSTTSMPSSFEGWYIAKETVVAVNCLSSGKFSTSGTYADCANPTNPGPTGLATACVDGVVHFKEGGKYTCPGYASCVAMTIAQTWPLGNPVYTRHMCRRDFIRNTIYREYPSLAIATTTQTTSTGTASTSAAPTATDSGASSGSGHSSLSGGAIAGIVIGCVAAVIILGLVFMRKRIAACFGKRQAESTTYYPSQQEASEMKNAHEMDSAASGQHQIHEMGPSAGEPMDVHELDSGYK